MNGCLEISDSRGEYSPEPTFLAARVETGRRPTKRKSDGDLSAEGTAFLGVGCNGRANDNRWQ